MIELVTTLNTAGGTETADGIKISSDGNAIVTSDGNWIKNQIVAWCNFQTGGALTDYYNIGSVVKNDTGQYTVTFKNALSDANYAVLVSNTANFSNSQGGNPRMFNVPHDLTTSSFKVNFVGDGGTFYDPDNAFILVIGGK